MKTKLSLQDISEVLQQLKYTDIKQLKEDIFSAKTVFSEDRIFACSYVKDTNTFILISDMYTNNTYKVLKVDHQQLEVEFVAEDTDNEYKIQVLDIVKSDMMNVLDLEEDTEVEVVDMNID